jgi:PAS domain S-box-containing protein
MLENSTREELQQRINELEREAVEAKRSQAEAALKETMDIVNRSPIVVFLWENQEGWPVRFVSENVVDLFGYTAEEFMSGKISYDATVHPDDLERVMDEVSRYSAEKGIQNFRHKPYRIITKEGNEKHISDLTTLRRNDHGEITHYEGILYDVSELIRKEEQIKASLKEKDALLSEIHHRVKNNMQIIISLLRLQSGKIEDRRHADMFKEAENRIRSMALIHENLYQTGDFADIDFHGYVRSLVNNLLRSRAPDRARVKLKIEVENVSLGMDTAIPCGLLINEVISNSLKHAFPDHREGEIEVTFRPVNGREFELIISDDGIGMPLELNFDTSDSMGLMLVKILAVDQLEGAVNLDRDGGTAFRIRFERKS